MLFSSRSLLGVFLCALCIICVFPLVCQGLTLPVIFNDHMVLQRGEARIWGWTYGPNVKIFVMAQFLDGSTRNWSGVSSAQSPFEFVVSIDYPSAAYNVTLEIADGQDDIQVLEDVAFGDVYLCGGQSNMELTVPYTLNPSVELADSSNYPYLRVFSLVRLTAFQPTMNMTHRGPYAWGVSGPNSLNGGAFDYFSATCYYTGRDIYKQLQISNSEPTPIGLVSSNWGGTCVQAWTSADFYGKCPPPSQADLETEAETTESFRSARKMFESFTLESEQVQQPGGAAVSGEADPNPPPWAVASLYNGMIAPITNMAFSGVFWYQGECNVDQYVYYSCAFPNMITNWRTKLAQPNLPFYFVLLASFGEGGPHWPLIRQAQLSGLTLPNTGVASAIDTGDPIAPAGDIHPRFKQIVGARLSALALANIYGQSIITDGPALTGVNYQPANNVVIFDYSDQTARSGYGLKFQQNTNCTVCCTVSPFEVAYSTNTSLWLPAPAIIEGNQVLVSVPPSQANLTGVRLMWKDYVDCSLASMAGIPALPVIYDF